MRSFYTNQICCLDDYRLNIRENPNPKEKHATIGKKHVGDKIMSLLVTTKEDDKIVPLHPILN